MQTTLTHLACSDCAREYDAQVLQTVCGDCARPLLARYDLARAAATLTLECAQSRPRGMAAYAEVMPFSRPHLDLGEARGRLVRAERLDEVVGGAAIFVQDESTNPTGSFKARGLSAAVSRARTLGVVGVALPTAGNAGMAMAAYAAAAGLKALVVCPRDTPTPFVVGARLLGAEVVLHEGLIDDCGALAASRAREEGLFMLSTLKEPYRAEGKKTMGYDVVRALGDVPDVIVYPTGGGTGIVGMWKAWEEMEGLGWIGARRPRMVSVQAAGCAPFVTALSDGRDTVTPWEGAHTVASGLRVPRAVGDRLVLRALRESGGTAIAVSDPEMLTASGHLGAACGVLAAPEGGACLAAARRLTERGWIAPGERVVLFNTGTALSYESAWR